MAHARSIQIAYGTALSILLCLKLAGRGSRTEQDPVVKMASPNRLKAAKKELRALVRDKLSRLSREGINIQSSNVSRSVVGLQAYQAAQNIGIYLAMPSGEIQTEAIVGHALDSGKRVFVPYLYQSQTAAPGAPHSLMEMVRLHDLADFQSLKPDKWGIPSVGSDNVDKREHVLQDKQSLDLILMPGVAFDIDPTSGLVRRLGHGKGFYDYFLHRYLNDSGSLREATVSSKPDILLYGLALEEQLLKAEEGRSVPIDQHDRLLHGLLVGNGMIMQGRNHHKKP